MLAVARRQRNFVRSPAVMAACTVLLVAYWRGRTAIVDFNGLRSDSGTSTKRTAACELIKGRLAIVLRGRKRRLRQNKWQKQGGEAGPVESVDCADRRCFFFAESYLRCWDGAAGNHDLHQQRAAALRIDRITSRRRQQWR